MAGSPPNGRSQAVQLGADLRELRKLTGKTVIQVAEVLGMHHSTISRWERGDTMPDEADTSALLTIYGLIDHERRAAQITEVNPLLIPGLVQTRDYAKSLMIGAGLPLGRAEKGSIIRMGRQNVLTRRNPVRFRAVIGEQAIRYPACERAIMADQLHHLLTMNERPNVEIRILPMDRRQYSIAFEGRFILIEFLRENPVVQLESYWSNSILTNPRAVGSYQDAVDMICADTLSVAESSAFISGIA